MTVAELIARAIAESRGMLHVFEEGTPWYVQSSGLQFMREAQAVLNALADNGLAITGPEKRA